MATFKKGDEIKITVPVVFPAGWVDILNDLAQERNVSRSELIRSLIRDGLETKINPSAGQWEPTEG